MNDALKEEIQHLKVVTGQTIPNSGGHMMNVPASYSTNQQRYANDNAVHTLLTTQQLQQLQIHSQKQHQLLQLQQQASIQQQEQAAEDMKLKSSRTSPVQKEFTPDGSSSD